jgi:mono/diheme cytochrome c family protein
MSRIRIACWLGISLCVGSSMLAEDKPTTPAITPVAVGQEMFRTDCASCHGLDAKGRGPAASALKAKPTDLTQLSKRNGGRFPSAMVENAIQGNGLIPAHGSRAMPVWGDAFRSVNRDEALVKIKVHNLVLYIESVQEK